MLIVTFRNLLKKLQVTTSHNLPKNSKRETEHLAHKRENERMSKKPVDGPETGLACVVLVLGKLSG